MEERRGNWKDEGLTKTEKGGRREDMGWRWRDG
jgi:hypothetical protein